MKAMAPRKTVDQLLRERLREIGALGGKTSAKKLSNAEPTAPEPTAAEPTATAKKAATPRWSQKQEGSLKVHGDPLDPPKKVPAKKKGK